jgi:hypothetical protein
VPVKKTNSTKSGRNGCYKYGKTGKKYCGSGAKAKAARQGRAIEASKRRKKA